MKSWFLVIMLACSAQATELTELSGSPVSSMQQLEGKVVLVDFWASWCTPCRKSFPWLNTVQQRHAADGLVILAVNEDQVLAEASTFLQQVPANFSILYDHEGALATQYKVMGMPSSYLIDKKGVIRFQHIGFKQANLAEYEQQIQQLLAEE